MSTIAARDLVVCGLRAHRAQVTQHQDVIDVTTAWDNEPQTIAGEASYTAAFSFLLSYDDIARAEQLFPIGEGSMTGHHLGPADVCQYCGTAWLPGTFVCSSCGGTTNHFDHAIEYESYGGTVTHKRLAVNMTGIHELDIEVSMPGEQAQLWMEDMNGVVTAHFKMQFDLWRNAPALWVCRFCGYVVMGKTSDCPGCGGKRVKIDRLATQQRLCVYCGSLSIGGYACKRCNQRLMAQEVRA